MKKFKESPNLSSILETALMDHHLGYPRKGNSQILLIYFFMDWCHFNESHNLSWDCKNCSWLHKILMMNSGATESTVVIQILGQLIFKKKL